MERGARAAVPIVISLPQREKKNNLWLTLYATSLRFIFLRFRNKNKKKRTEILTFNYIKKE
jgi:hypothetical protein